MDTPQRKLHVALSDSVFSGAILECVWVKLMIDS